MIEREHGGISGYFSSIGIDDELQIKIKKKLLEEDV